jgi:hypothetical protein
MANNIENTLISTLLPEDMVFTRKMMNRAHALVNNQRTGIDYVIQCAAARVFMVIAVSTVPLSSTSYLLRGVSIFVFDLSSGHPTQATIKLLSETVNSLRSLFFVVTGLSLAILGLLPFAGGFLISAVCPKEGVEADTVESLQRKTVLLEALNRNLNERKTYLERRNAFLARMENFYKKAAENAGQEIESTLKSVSLLLKESEQREKASSWRHRRLQERQAVESAESKKFIRSLQQDLELEIAKLKLSETENAKLREEIAKLAETIQLEGIEAWTEPSPQQSPEIDPTEGLKAAQEVIYNKENIESFAYQIINAAKQCLDEVEETLEDLLNGHPNKISILANFKASAEVARKCIQAEQMKIYNEEYETISPKTQQIIHDTTGKEIVLRARQQIKEIEKSLLDQIKNCLEQLKSSINDATLSSALDCLIHEVPKLHGAQRFNLIHGSDLWKKGYAKKLEWVDRTSNSTIITLNRPYSSAAPRNRKRDFVLPNHTQRVYELTSASPSFPLLKKSATTAAVPVEFDQKDVVVRRKANIELVRQFLEVHAKNHLRDNPTLEGEITVPVQILALLTPDRFRAMAAYNNPIKVVAPADDEATLLSEYYAAVNYWREHSLEIDLGSDLKRSVKFNIHFHNVPCNEIYRQITLWGQFSSWAFTGEAFSIMSAGESSLLKLSKNKTVALVEYLERLNTAPLIKDLFGIYTKKHQLRQSLSSLKKESLSQARDQWSHFSDEFIQKIYEIEKNPSLTDTDRDYIKTLRKLDAIHDISDDLREIFALGHQDRLKACDDNPFAVPARVLTLGELLGNHLHFHCRSSKDRTGYVDGEFDLFLELGVTLGRYPAYFEQEKLDYIETFREKIFKESGSFTFIPELNLGGKFGMNIQGCAPIKGKELAKALIGLAAIFYRPGAAH